MTRREWVTIIVGLVGLLFVAVVAPNCTPTPTPTATPNAIGTSIAVLANRVLALEHGFQYVLPPIMTLEADLALTPSIETPTVTPSGTPFNATPTASVVAPTATTRPTATPYATEVQQNKPKCAKCAVFGEPCNVGLVCASCGTLGYRCVDSQQGCAACGTSDGFAEGLALAMHNYSGPPDPEIDLDALSQDSKERRFEP